MRRLWLWLVVTVKRLHCRWFGCVPCTARRHFVAGDETRVMFGVPVHCPRCWRQYDHAEQEDAARYLRETLP